jgi:hypothetical protein
MAAVFGITALLMGLVSFSAAIIRAARLERLESHQNEMGAIGWFILAALCFK